MSSWMKAFAVGALLAAGASAAHAQAGWRLEASAGVDYSTGDYGAPVDTEIVIAPLALRAQNGSWRVIASVPWTRVDGPAAVLSGGPGGPIVVDPDRGAARSVREGWGDLNLGAAYTLPAAATGRLEIDLSAGVKLGTGDPALSTGETDYAVAVDLALPLGAWTPSASLGYRVSGDSPSLDLEDSFNASLGISRAIGDRVVVLASYDYYQATSALVEDGHELFGAVSGPLTRRANWTVYGVAGLSAGSPDVEAGLMLTVPLS